MTLGQTIKSLKKNEGLLVTPKIETFLRDNPEGVVWDDEGWALFRGLTKAMFDTNSQRSE